MLNCSYTLSTAFEDWIFDLKNLKKLKAQNSQLIAFGDSIEKLTNLKKLCMDGNSELAGISEKIGKLPLEWISLDRCRSLNQLPLSLNIMTTLKVLKVNRSYLTVPISAKLDNLINTSSNIYK